MDFTKLRGIIFDFDGTMVDSEPVWKEVFVDVYRATHGVELTTPMLWENTGKGVDRSVATIDIKLDLGHDPTQQSFLVDSINEEVHRRILEETPLREGTVELLEFARANNIATAICTASTEELIATFLRNRDLTQYFDHITTTAYAPMHERKPEPFPYLKTLEALGVSAEEAIAIEDSPAGVTSALAAGIFTVAIPHAQLADQVSALNPTLLIQDFQQLLDHLSDGLQSTYKQQHQ
jgi:HAD superfamily hydrolase (TIGR01509 family)